MYIRIIGKSSFEAVNLIQAMHKGTHGVTRLSLRSNQLHARSAAELKEIIGAIPGQVISIDLSENNLIQGPDPMSDPELSRLLSALPAQLSLGQNPPFKHYF